MENWLNAIAGGISNKTASILIQCFSLPRWRLDANTGQLQVQPDAGLQRIHALVTSTAPAALKTTMKTQLSSRIPEDYENYLQLLHAYLDLLPCVSRCSGSDPAVLDAFIALASAFNFAFDEYWQVPLAKHIYTFLIKFAFQQDRNLKMEQVSTRSTKMSPVKQVCVPLDALRGKMFDRAPMPQSRKAGILFCSNLIFKCYLHLNNISQMQKVLDFVTNYVLQIPQVKLSQDGIDFEPGWFPAAERCAFHYNVGKFYLLQHSILKARRALERSFQLCHRDFIKHKRTILICLVACKLILGIFPLKDPMDGRYAVLKQYNLESQYHHLIESLKQGYIARFLHELDADDQSRIFFIRNHIYNVLKWRCQLILYRNLFKRTYIIGSTIAGGSTFGYSSLPSAESMGNLFNISAQQSQSSGQAPPRVSFADLGTALQLTGDPMFAGLETENISPDGTIILQKHDESAIERRNAFVVGILSRLVEAGFVKGNISLSNGCIVVSRAAAFPPLQPTIVKLIEKEMWDTPKGDSRQIVEDD